MSSVRGSLVIGLMVMSCLFCISLFPVSENAEAADVDAYLVLDQSTQEMPVQGGALRVVTFTGSVTCNLTGMGSGWEEVRVTLHARTQSGWVNSITPTEMTFSSGSETQTFTVSVNAPEGGLPQTTSEILTVDGTADEMFSTFVIATYNIAPQSATITIQQYYGVEVSSQALVKEGGDSETITYELKVTNLGNGLDKFYVNRIDYSRNPEMPDKGFKVSWDPEELTIPGRGTGNLVVRLKNPKDTPDSKVYNFTVVVRSKGSETGAGIISEDGISLVLQTKGGLSDIMASGGTVVKVAGGILGVVILAVVVFVVIKAVKRRRKKKAGIRAKFKKRKDPTE